MLLSVKKKEISFKQEQTIQRKLRNGAFDSANPWLNIGFVCPMTC